MRFVVVVALVAGCASDLEAPATDAELHEQVPCDDRWSTDVMPFTSGVTLCDAPCADALAVQQDDPGACYFDYPSTRFFAAGRSPGEYSCNSTFNREWRGRIGCCVPDVAPVTFALCKP